VQDPDEAERPDMPLAAIATGAVDLVAPAAQIGARLVELTRGSSR
jgi:chemotaxis response regulator CheB